MKTQNLITFACELNPAGGVTIVDVIGHELEAVAELEFPPFIFADGESQPVTAIELSKSARKSLCNLKTVALPEGLKSIGRNCFMGMGIEQVNFPSTLKEVGDLAFSDCKRLKAAILPEGLETIGEYAFSSVGSSRRRTRVYVPSTATMHESAFADSCLGRTEVHCRIIAESAFESAIFSSLKLGEQVCTISDCAFQKSNALYVLGSLPAGIRHIGNMAFQKAYPGYAKHSSISIPDGVSVGNWLFYDCKRLRKVDTGDATWTALMQADFTFAGSGIEELKMPKGAKRLGANVCSGCENLKSIEIPNSVTRIGNAAFKGAGAEWVSIPRYLCEIGDEAFSNMANCKYVNASVPVWKKLASGNYFSANGMEHITVPEGVDSIGGCAFSDCLNLYSVTLPKSLLGIGYNAFANCTMLQEIDIPADVELLDKEAFDSCYSLRKVRLHEGLKEIGECCFARCRSLNSLEVPSTVTRMGNEAFSDCCSLKRLVLKQKPSMKSYPMGCHESVDWYVPDEYVEEAKALCAGSMRRILPLSRMEPLEPLPKEQVAPAGMKRVRLRIEYDDGCLLLARKVEPEHLPLLADRDNAALVLGRYLLEGFDKFETFIMAPLGKQDCVVLNRNYSVDKTFNLSACNLQPQPTPWAIGEPTLLQPFKALIELQCSFFVDKDKEVDATLLKFDYSNMSKNRCIDPSHLYYDGKRYDCDVFVRDISVCIGKDLAHCNEDSYSPIHLYGHDGEVEAIVGKRFQLSVDTVISQIEKMV